MSDELTLMATPDNNAWEAYYRAYCNYDDKKNKLQRAQETIDSRRRSLQKATQAEQAFSQSKEMTITSRSSELFKERQQSVIRKYERRLGEIKEKLARVENDLRSLQEKGRPIQNREKSSKELRETFSYAYALREKVDADCADFSEQLGYGRVESRIDQCKTSVEANLSRDFLAERLKSVPGPYKPRKWVKGFLLALGLPFMLEVPALAVMHAIFLVVLVIFMIVKGILGSVFIGFLAVLAILAIIPRMIAHTELDDRAFFYYIVLNLDQLLNKILDDEYGVFEAEEAAKYRERLSNLQSAKNELSVSKANIEGFIQNEISQIDIEAINHLAKNEFDSRFQEFVDARVKAEAAYAGSVARHNKIKEDILAFSDYREQLIESVREQAEAIKRDRKYTVTKGKIWDSLYFEGSKISSDEQGISVVNKLTHGLRPQVILYRDASPTPAHDFADLVVQIAGTLRIGLPDDFIRQYVVDTVGGATAYAPADMLFTRRIGKIDAIKFMEREIESVQSKISTDIASINSQRLSNGDRPYPYTISYIFIPQVNSSSPTNILSEGLKQMVRQKGKNGFLPIFFIATEDWYEIDSPGHELIAEIKEHFVEPGDVHWINNDGSNVLLTSPTNS